MKESTKDAEVIAFRYASWAFAGPFFATAASYLLAKHEDCGKVARWLGNSPGILLRNYTELVSAEDCLAFWNIRP